MKLFSRSCCNSKPVIEPYFINFTDIIDVFNRYEISIHEQFWICDFNRILSIVSMLVLCDLLSESFSENWSTILCSLVVRLHEKVLYNVLSAPYAWLNLNKKSINLSSFQRLYLLIKKVFSLKNGNLSYSRMEKDSRKKLILVYEHAHVLYYCSLPCLLWQMMFLWKNVV